MSGGTHSVASDRLVEAFADFERASGSLERRYAALAERVRLLDGALNESDLRLARSLAERERVTRCLDALLENLACGVVVVDPRGAVLVSNREGRRLCGEGPEGTALDEGFLADLAARALGEGAPATGRTRARAREADGRWIDLDVAYSPLPPGTADEPGLVVLLSDVTDERRRDEREQRRARLESLGRMAAEVAHEVRNPLGSLELFTGLLRHEVEDRSEARELADLILAGLRQIDGVVTGLLAFSRGKAPRPRPSDLAEVAREASRFARPLAEARSVRLRVDESGPVAAFFDPGQMQQVALNLVRNAVEASPEGGEVRLAARPERNGGARLVIEDGGPGIAPELASRVFDPFFSARDGGTGLGLPVACRIVEAHGGSLELQARTGSGTRAVVCLPPETKDEVSG